MIKRHTTSLYQNLNGKSLLWWHKAWRVMLQAVIVDTLMLELLAKHTMDTVICREVSKLQHSVTVCLLR